VTVSSLRGQATLSLVLLVGGIATAIVIAIAVVSVTLVGTGFGADAQQRARAVAMAGIEDGALRFARNSSDSASYALTVGSSTASVVLYPNTPSAGYSSVYSEATVGVRKARLYGTYAIDPVTFVPTLVSLTNQ
jgi:hypothetical protein